MMLIMDKQETLKDRLLNRRRLHGWSQKRLAAITGLERLDIQCFEAGRRIPCLKSLCLIADAFRCSTDYLLGRTPWGFLGDPMYLIVRCNDNDTPKLYARKTRELTKDVLSEIENSDLIEVIDISNPYKPRSVRESEHPAEGIVTLRVAIDTFKGMEDEE